MASAQTATLDAVNECKRMTQYLIAALEEQKAKTLNYEELLAEWTRRQGLYTSSKAQFDRLCVATGCASATEGDVQKRGCNPMCLNWVTLNPAPLKPTPPVPPDLGTFVCSICSQSVDIDANAGRDINVLQGAINQQMACTTTLEKQISDAASSDASDDASDDASSGSGSSNAGSNPPPVTTNTTTDESSSQKSNIWTYVIVGIILVILIIGILVAIYFFTGDDDTPIRAETTK